MALGSKKINPASTFSILAWNYQSLNSRLCRVDLGWIVLAWRILGKLPSNLSANFDGEFFFREFFGLVSPWHQAKIHAQTWHPNLLALLSNFTFSNPNFVHADFQLTGGTNWQFWLENFNLDRKFQLRCFYLRRPPGVQSRARSNNSIHYRSLDNFQPQRPQSYFSIPGYTGNPEMAECRTECLTAPCLMFIISSLPFCPHFRVGRKSIFQPFFPTSFWEGPKCVCTRSQGLQFWGRRNLK